MWVTGLRKSVSAHETVSFIARRGFLLTVMGTQWPNVIYRTVIESIRYFVSLCQWDSKYFERCI